MARSLLLLLDEAKNGRWLLIWDAVGHQDHLLAERIGEGSNQSAQGVRARFRYERAQPVVSDHHRCVRPEDTTVSPTANVGIEFHEIEKDRLMRVGYIDGMNT